MFSASSTVQKIIGTCFLMALFVSFASMYLHVRSMGNMDVAAAECPFMSGSSVICTMNPSQHISAWQHMFVSTPIMGTLLLLMVIIMLALKRTELLSWLWKIPRSELSYYRKLAPTKKYSSANYLQEIFSQGILNPKLF